MPHDADGAHVQLAHQIIHAKPAIGIYRTEFVQMPNYQLRTLQGASIAIAGAAVVGVHIVCIDGNHRITMACQVTGQVLIAAVTGNGIFTLLIRHAPGAAVTGTMAPMKKQNYRCRLCTGFRVMDVAVQRALVGVVTLVIVKIHGAEIVLVLGNRIGTHR